MPAPNRVAPTGEIVPIAQRGLFLGNRGCIHDAPRHLARRWQVRRWITCALRYKDWRAPMWEPRRWTPLFFWDEAVALAAGHRPCALCRHRDYVAWCDAWQAATGTRLGADAMDRVLHADRLDGREQRRHTRPWRGLPPGTFVRLGPAPPTPVTDRAAERPPASPDAPAAREVPALVLGDALVPWSSAGYGSPVERPSRGEATVLTPAVTVRLLEAGYDPVIRPGVGT